MVQAGEVPPHQLPRAATLAVKIFKKSQESSAATRQPTVVSYINILGGTRLQQWQVTFGCLSPRLRQVKGYANPP